MRIWSLLYSTSALLSLVRIGGAGIGFVTQLLLARLLTPHDLGIFFFVSSVATVASLVVATGYPSLMVRFVSRYRERGQAGRLAAFIRRAQVETLVWSVIGAAALAMAGWLMPGIEDGARIAFAISAATIVPMGLQRVRGTIAIAYRRFMASYLPSLFVRPALFAAILVGLLIAGVNISVEMLTAILFATFVFSAILQHWTIRDLVRPSAKAKADRRLLRRWRAEAWPLVLVATFTALLSELAIILAAPFMSMADVGAFGICLKIAFLIGFTVQVSHQVILPDMGDAVARRQGGAISAKIVGASILPIALTISGVLVSALFGDRILAVFNPAFARAQDTMTILMVAQFVRAIAGPSSLLLTLKGAQGTSAIVCALSSAVLLAANAGLAPLWGTEGAALAVLITTVFWLGATAIALHRMDGARADVLSLLVNRLRLARASGS